jgi:hypothetical protein
MKENVCMEQIVKLREQNNKIELEIKQKKNNQLNIFKKRFEALKQNGEFLLENEVIYSCLFGNGIN